MEHLAIMKKSWDLTNKIISGEKKIESRWYKNKYLPWNKIKEGEIVYFKDSGSPVSIKTEVEKVLQFSNLTPNKVKQILEDYGKDDGINQNKIEEFFQLFKDKKYCMLIFLKNPQKIEPFEITKKGFGMVSAWICVNNINILRKD